MMLGILLAAAGAYPWTMVLERVDRPTETRWVTNEVESIAVTTGFRMDADGSRVAYAYTDDGKLAERVWARGVKTW